MIISLQSLRAATELLKLAAAFPAFLSAELRELYYRLAYRCWGL